jgi:hypothetical protein
MKKIMAVNLLKIGKSMGLVGIVDASFLVISMIRISRSRFILSVISVRGVSVSLSSNYNDLKFRKKICTDILYFTSFRLNHLFMESIQGGGRKRPHL